MSGSITNGGTIGSGSDSIVLNVAEDQAQGVDANFTVNVDGQQIGGIETATASQSAGQREAFTFLGNYGVGSHNVTVTFDNNFIYPGESGDRNLYVDGVSYDGQTVSSTTTGIYQSPLFPPNSDSGNIYGNAVFSVNDTTPVPSDGSSTPSTTPGAVSIGSGADTLVLNMAEDPFQGDAQFNVAMDGQQVDGTQTVTASVEQGQQQEFDVHGNWGGGNHTVTVNYTNDSIGGVYPGTLLGLDTADRNLYVMGASLDGGSPASGTPWELSSAGSQSFTVSAGSNPGAGSATTTSAAAPVAATSSSNTSSTAGSGATSDNATVTPATLSAGQASTGSSSGMSFVASPTDGGTGAAATGSTGSSGGTTTDTTSAAASVGAAAPSVQDLSSPPSVGVTDTSNGWSGGGGQWWMNHQNGDWSAYHHQG